MVSDCDEASILKPALQKPLDWPRFAGLEAKSMLDLVLSALSLFLLSPLLILVAVAIHLDSKGPTLFKQTRTGLHGKTFRICKFRTMSVLEDGPYVQQATPDDERVTRIGRWLRQMSIDEIPQLVNVLRGEMSLVGPRPHALAHDQYYSQRIVQYDERFRVKPGITGWAQINDARGETPTLADMQRRVDLDLWYIQNWALILDLKILALTIVCELTRSRRAF
jgi:exopolysaccharide biosynthesis polyprenyl glycosylphosphotransferase